MATTYLAVVYREGGLYMAECPEVGTASNGETVEEALKMLTAAYLEAAGEPDNGQSVIMTTITVQKAS